MDEVARLRSIIDEIHSWVVCAAIAYPDDMAQNFPRIAEITDPGFTGEGRAASSSNSVLQKPAEDKMHLSSELEESQTALSLARTEIASLQAQLRSCKQLADRGEWLTKELMNQGLLEYEFCQVGKGDHPRNRWVLWPPYAVNRVGGPLAYADSVEEVFSKAIKERP